MKKVNTDKYIQNSAPDVISDDHNEMIINVMHLNMLFERTSSRFLDEKFTFNQFRVLSMIDLGICSRSSELALHLNVSKANITGLIRRLEKRGLLYRKEFEDDYRVKILILTEMGEQFLRSKRLRFFALANIAMSDIEAEAAKKTNESLSKVIEALREGLNI